MNYNFRLHIDLSCVLPSTQHKRPIPRPCQVPGTIACYHLQRPPISVRVLIPYLFPSLPQYPERRRQAPGISSSPQITNCLTLGRHIKGRIHDPGADILRCSEIQVARWKLGIVTSKLHRRQHPPATQNRDTQRSQWSSNVPSPRRRAEIPPKHSDGPLWPAPDFARWPRESCFAATRGSCVGGHLWRCRMMLSCHDRTGRCMVGRRGRRPEGWKGRSSFFEVVGWRSRGMT